MSRLSVTFVHARGGTQEYAAPLFHNTCAHGGAGARPARLWGIVGAWPSARGYPKGGGWRDGMAKGGRVKGWQEDEHGNRVIW
jgi:hypothetical protein